MDQDLKKQKWLLVKFVLWQKIIIKIFFAGQIFSYEGFISPQGTVGEIGEEGDNFLLITYRKDFESHEESHKDKIIMNAFEGVLEFV